jgi:hypothetical protein
MEVVNLVKPVEPNEEKFGEFDRKFLVPETHEIDDEGERALIITHFHHPPIKLQRRQNQSLPGCEDH